MLVNTMADSDNIWQWCNARKKMCHQRSAVAATVWYDAFSTKVVPLKEQEVIKHQKKKAERYAAFLCHDPLSLSSYESIGESTKFSDRQCLADPVEQPTTPDLEDPVSKTRELELSKLHSIASPCFSNSVCGQTSADSSTSASIVHDEAAEDGMHLQSMDFSSPPSCNNKNPSLEQMGFVPKSPKIENCDLKKDQSLISRIPTRGFLRNLRPLGGRKAKPKVSSDGLDLLVKAIFLLENWGNKGFPAHQQCKVRLAFIDTGLQKKRVIRRAKSAYKHRCKNEEPGQLHNLLEADSKRELQSNLLSELGIAPTAKPNKKQLDQHQAEALQSHLMSRLRRSLRNSQGN